MSFLEEALRTVLEEKKSLRSAVSYNFTSWILTARITLPQKLSELIRSHVAPPRRQLFFTTFPPRRDGDVSIAISRVPSDTFFGSTEPPVPQGQFPQARKFKDSSGETSHVFPLIFPTGLRPSVEP